MPEDLLVPPVAEPVDDPPEVPARKAGTIVCEFCECEITGTQGQVINRSRKALRYLDTELVIRDLRRDSASHQERAERLQRDLDALKLEQQREKPLTADKHW